jgi:hypothetical protein
MHTGAGKPVTGLWPSFHRFSPWTGMQAARFLLRAKQRTEPGVQPVLLFRWVGFTAGPTAAAVDGDGKIQFTGLGRLYPGA